MLKNINILPTLPFLKTNIVKNMSIYDLYNGILFIEISEIQILLKNQNNIKR